MRVFLASAYYTYRGTLAWLTPPMFVAQKMFIPLGQVSFFSLIGQYGGGQPLEFYLVGNAMLTAATAITFISLMIDEERLVGTLQFLSATPANRLALFAGRTAGHFVEGVVWVAIAFGWAVLVFGLDIPPGAWAGLLLAILVAAAAAAGLGLLLGGLAFVSVDVQISINGAIFLLLLVSGANIPTDELPGWLAAVGDLLPLKRSIEAARLLTDGEPLSEALPYLVGDLLVGAAYATAGLLLFRWLEAQARRRGTLEGF